MVCIYGVLYTVLIFEYLYRVGNSLNLHDSSSYSSSSLQFQFLTILNCDSWKKQNKTVPGSNEGAHQLVWRDEIIWTYFMNFLLYMDCTMIFSKDYFEPGNSYQTCEHIFFQEGFLFETLKKIESYSRYWKHLTQRPFSWDNLVLFFYRKKAHVKRYVWGGHKENLIQSI